LCREYETHIHIVHLSSSDILPEISQTRDEGLPLTVETCPHYLHFASERISDGDTRFKCAPPIWGADNREKLWAGLEKGTIDFITSDHSPCTPELKQLDTGDFQMAWGGISSIQFILPVIWTECRQRGFSLVQLTNWLSKSPAEFIGKGQQKGQIAPGYDADLVCWDPDAKFLVEQTVIHHRHKMTPYEGENLFGAVNKTFLRGQKVFDNGSFVGRPHGKIVMGNHGT